METDDAHLVPDRWTGADGKPVSIELWLSGIGRYDHAIAYAGLFWPTFIEVQGCVILTRNLASFQGFWEQTGGDRRSVEAVLNHCHFLDLFRNAPQPTRAQVLWLGRKLQEIWSAKLTRDFPGKHFTFSFEEDFDLAVDNPEITFWQE